MASPCPASLSCFAGDEELTAANKPWELAIILGLKYHVSPIGCYSLFKHLCLLPKHKGKCLVSGFPRPECQAEGEDLDVAFDV